MNFYSFMLNVLPWPEVSFFCCSDFKINELISWIPKSIAGPRHCAHVQDGHSGSAHNCYTSSTHSLTQQTCQTLVWGLGMWQFRPGANQTKVPAPRGGRDVVERKRHIKKTNNE